VQPVIVDDRGKDKAGMNPRRLLIISISFLLSSLWCVALQAAASLSSYPADPSGNSPAFTRAHVDKLGRLLVFGSASGGPKNDNSIRAFDGSKWQYLWPNSYTNGGAQVRHNHGSFYVPSRDEFWIFGGSHLETLPGAFRSGRFGVGTKKWLAVSTTDSGAFDGIIKGGIASLATMATAWSQDADVGMTFGGSQEGNPVDKQFLIEPNPSGPEAYRLLEYTGSRPPIRTQCMNCMVAVGSDFYLYAGTYQEPGGPYVNRKDLWKFDSKRRIWTQLPDAPGTSFAPVITYDAKANALVAWAGNKILVYDIATQKWSDQTPVGTGFLCVINHVGGYLGSINAHLYEGGNDCATGNSRRPGLIGISLGLPVPLRH
jgi:hypothetical protein